MGNFSKAGLHLRAALQEWVSALGAYLRETSNTGRRLVRGEWKRAEALLAEVTAAAAAIAAPIAAPAEGAPSSLASAMDLGDRYETALSRAATATQVFLDPMVAAAVASGTSHTYSDNIRGLTQAVRAAREEAEKAFALLMSAASQAGSATAQAAPATGEVASLKTGRGSVATELYVSALKRGGKLTARLLEDAKDATLGLSPDTPAAAAESAGALAKYHPLQAMCYAPRAFEARSSEARSSEARSSEAQPPLSLRLPQSRLTCEYSLLPLVDRRAAAQYGPLASANSGLNYRLVERLRTIRAEPTTPAAAAAATAAAAAAAATAAVIEGPLLVTTDGRTAKEIPGEGTWAPLAGARPRVERYAEMCAEVVTAALRAATWPGRQLRAEYEQAKAGLGPGQAKAGLGPGQAKADGRKAKQPKAAPGSVLPDGYVSGPALVRALVDEFGRRLDGVRSPHDMRSLRSLAADPGYLTIAVAAAGAVVLADWLTPVQFAIGPAVPLAVAERESYLSLASHAAFSPEATTKLVRLMRGALAAEKSGAHGPEREPALDREAALDWLRRLAAKALASERIQCIAPSVKLYAVLGLGRH